VKALDKRTRPIKIQTMPDPTDETKRAIPCPNRLVHIATIARTNVARKKMNPNPKIQNVRKSKNKTYPTSLDGG